MNEDRLMVAQAVLEGKIGEEHLTHEEADELVMRVGEIVFEQEMEKAVERGLNVFSGMEDYDTVH